MHAIFAVCLSGGFVNHQDMFVDRKYVLIVCARMPNAKLPHAYAIRYELFDLNMWIFTPIDAAYNSFYAFVCESKKQKKKKNIWNDHFCKSLLHCKEHQICVAGNEPKKTNNIKRWNRALNCYVVSTISFYVHFESGILSTALAYTVWL